MQERRRLAFPSEEWVLTERIHCSRGESRREACGVRKSLQKIRGRSDNPPLVWGYPPFLGRFVVLRSGIARGKPVGTVLGGFRSLGGRIWGFPGRRSFRVESPAGAEELGGAEEIAGAEDIAGAVAIASVGINI